MHLLFRFFDQLRRHFCLLRWKSCDWQVSVLPSNCAVSQSRPLNVDLLPRGVAEDLQSSATALNDFLKNCQHVNALLGSTTCSHYVTICMKKHVYIYLSIYTHFKKMQLWQCRLLSLHHNPVGNKSCPVKCELYTHMHVTMMIHVLEVAYEY